jgi:hypothetical protein
MLYVSLDDWAEEIPFDEYDDTSDWLRRIWLTDHDPQFKKYHELTDNLLWGVLIQ